MMMSDYFTDMPKVQFVERLFTWKSSKSSCPDIEYPIYSTYQKKRWNTIQEKGYSYSSKLAVKGVEEITGFFQHPLISYE